MGDIRKIQRTPTGTFFVCLPRNWATQNNLKKGTLVSIDITDDGKLVVDSKYNTEQPSRVATLSIGPYIGREIIGKYLLGYDVIRIEAKDRIDYEVRDLVKKTVSKLIGLEIVEENYSQIVLQCLIDPSGFEPEKILRRNHAIVAGMIKDVAHSLINADSNLAKNVIARDDESNRLYFLLVRILRTILQNFKLREKVGITLIDCMDYRLAASLIEAMGDACVQVAAKTITLNGVKPSEGLQKLLTDLQTVCSDAHEQALKSFVNKDVVTAENVRSLRRKVDSIYNSIEKVAKANPLDIMPQILAALSFLRQIFENSIDLTDLVA